MKTTPKKLIALTLLALLVAIPLRAQTNPPAAQETNSRVAAPADTQVSTSNPDAQHPPVRVDDSGIHVGGPNPVDIKIPRHSRLNDNVAVIVPLAGIFIGFAIPVSIIGILAFARHRRHKIANETLRAMIEKGMPITPELVDSLKAKHSDPGEGITGGQPRGTANRPQRDLRSGIILTGIGIGIVMLCGRPGWIVLFLGVAFMLIGFLNLGGKHDDRDQTPR